MRTFRYRFLFVLGLMAGLHVHLFSQEDVNVFRESAGASEAFTGTDSIVDARINFNGDWRFHLGEVGGFYLPGYDDGDWRQLDVPHDWSIEGSFDPDHPSGASGGFLPGGTGCYRKSFILPEGSEGKRIKIRFDGVYMNSSVYVNGVFLGLRPYGFSTFEYDLTPHLKHDGEENLIAVKADNSLQPSSRWYTGSGINRNVHLYIMEQQHFQSYETFVRAVDVSEESAKLKLDCQVVSNAYPGSEKIKFQSYPGDASRIIKDSKIVARLMNPKGKEVASSKLEQDLSDYSELEAHLELDIAHPELWSHAHPVLYTLELQLWVEDQMVDTETHRIGIREIEFTADQGMLVNGEKVIIKGVCLHKDAGSFGTAVPEDVWRYRLRKLKALGCNGIRTHGPVDPVFIDLCDEMGFYMMSEAFDEWDRTWEYGYTEDPWGKLPYTYNKYFRQWAETDLKDMVRRDRNHPSVILYSVGNEVPNQRYADGPETLMNLINWAKEEDDTRPVIAPCDWAPWANLTGFLDSADIAGYNYPDRYFPNHHQEEHDAYPGRIVLGTENYETLENWLMVRDQPYAVGMFLWVGIDYLGEALVWPRRGWEWGLMDIAGFEKSLYYYWQAFWSDDPMVHIAVNLKEKDTFKWKCYNLDSHWNFPADEVDTVFVMSNTEEVELFLNRKSLGRKKVDPDTYQAIYLVDYKEGSLEAIAYEGGKQVADHILKTAGEPRKLALISEKDELNADTEELVFLTLEVQDKKGTRCPHAKNEIRVEVEGNGQLIGLDSGNQFSHELYKQSTRKAHEGRLLLSIRPTGKGSIRVECSSEGLDRAETTIKVIK